MRKLILFSILAMSTSCGIKNDDSTLKSNTVLAENFSGPGRFRVQTQDIFLADQSSAKVSFPQNPANGGKKPVVVLAHGFAAGPAQMIGWGERLASYGFIAIAPKLCDGFVCAPKGEEATRRLRLAIEFLRSSAAGSQLSQAADLNRIALLGYSAGGQASLLSLSSIPAAALILLDPVGGEGPTDLSTDTEIAAIRNVRIPTLTLFAEPDLSGGISCNKRGVWREVDSFKTSQASSFKVNGASHCDGENPPGPLCGAPFVGCDRPANPRVRETINEYVVAFLQAKFEANSLANQAFLNFSLASDPRISEINLR